VLKRLDPFSDAVKNGDIGTAIIAIDFAIIRDLKNDLHAPIDGLKRPKLLRPPCRASERRTVLAKEASSLR
jgi:hypothetical protein